MSWDDYYDIIIYLTAWMFPENRSPKQRKRLKNLARQYEVIEGKLYKKVSRSYSRRLVVKQGHVLKILKEHHDHLLAGHQGISRTFDAIRKRYYWPGYFDTVCEIEHIQLPMFLAEIRLFLAQLDKTMNIVASFAQVSRQERHNDNHYPNNLTDHNPLTNIDPKKSRKRKSITSHYSH